MRSTLRFEEAIKSEATRKNYRYHLDQFKKFVKIPTDEGLLQIKESGLQEMLEDYLFTLKRKVNPNSIPAYFFGIKLFFSMNDRVLNWTKIEKMYPAKVKISGSKAYKT